MLFENSQNTIHDYPRFVLQSDKNGFSWIVVDSDG